MTCGLFIRTSLFLLGGICYTTEKNHCYIIRGIMEKTDETKEETNASKLHLFTFCFGNLYNVSITNLLKGFLPK